MPDQHTTTTGPKGPERFRKKPVEVEAVHLTEHVEPDEVARWCGGKVEPHPDEQYTGGRLTIAIETLEGTMRAVPGDWIIRGVQGEFYPCKPDIFEATYEPAEQDHPAPSLGPDVGKRLERIARALAEDAERQGFQARIDADRASAAFLRDLAKNLGDGGATEAELQKALEEAEDRFESCDNCERPSREEDLKVVWGREAESGELVDARICLICRLEAERDLGDGGQGEADRERADRLEVECRELEDANRSLARMRDAALEGNLAVAQPVPSCLSKEGAGQHILQELDMRAELDEATAERVGGIVLDALASMDSDGGTERRDQVWLDALEAKGLVNGEEVEADPAEVAEVLAAFLAREHGPILQALLDLERVNQDHFHGGEQERQQQIADAIGDARASLSASSDTGGAGEPLALQEHQEIAAREVLEAERRARANIRQNLDCELKRREDEEPGLAAEGEDQGIPEGERLAFTRSLVMESFDKVATSPQQSVPDTGEAETERLVEIVTEPAPHADRPLRETARQRVERIREDQAAPVDPDAPVTYNCCDDLGRDSQRAVEAIAETAAKNLVQPDPPGEVLGREGEDCG